MIFVRTGQQGLALELVLGKHSGRHAFVDRIEHLGYALTPEQVQTAFGLFKKLCDTKKDVTDGDLAALIADEILLKGQQNRYELKRYFVKTGEGPARRARARRPRPDPR